MTGKRPNHRHVAALTFLGVFLTLSLAYGQSRGADGETRLDMSGFPKPSQVITGGERVLEDWWEHIDAVGWGYMIYLDEAFDWYRDTVIQPAHDHGVAYIGSVSTADPEVALGPDMEKRLEHARVKNIDGEPIGFVFCIANDAYYGFELEYTKRSIDQGMDGVIIDEPESVGVYGWCYCDGCISRFREYLRKEFSSEELERKWDIKDVATFSHRRWMREHSDETQWEDAQNALRQAYRTFYEDLAVTFQSKLMREAKQYAREAHGRSFFTSVNLRPFERWGYRLSQHLDAAYYEFKGGEPTGDMYPQVLRPGFPPKTSSIAISRLFAAFGLKLVLQNQITEMTTGEVEPSGNLIKPTLKRIIQAEVTAAGGNYKCHNGTWSPALDGIYEDPDITGRDYDWIRSHAELLDDYEPIPGDYAIVISVPMCRHETDAMQTRYWGAAHLLLRTHRHFDVLAWGDGRDYPDTISPEILAKYKAVVLPNLSIMTEAMVEKLLQYVRRGGCLILLEKSALSDENLKPTEHAVWQDITSDTQAYDKGQIVLIDSDFGVFRYEGAEDRGLWTLEDPDLGTHYFLTLNEHDLTLFDETISKYVQEDFETDLHRDVVLAAQNVRTYRDGTWRQALHLVNNDYDFETDKVTPHKGTITFKLPNWNGEDKLSIALHRFTRDEHETLDYTVLAEGRIRVELPAINIWSIVAITPSSRK